MDDFVLRGKPVPSPGSVDNGIVMAYVPPNPHAKNFLVGVRADYSAAVSAVKAITLKTAPATLNGLLQAQTLARGTTATNISTTDEHYVDAGVARYKAAVAAGVALPAGTIPINKWGIYRLTVDAAGTITVTAGAANYSTGYNDEAAAIAALPALPSGSVDYGHVTVLTAVGFTFVAGTDALQGGVGGNPASNTNYYPATALALATVDNISRWDFSKGPALLSLPAVYGTDRNVGLVVELAASGTGGIDGEITAWVSAP